MGRDTNFLLNNVYTILVKILIKLILIYLSNWFFNFVMKMKNEKRSAIFDKTITGFFQLDYYHQKVNVGVASRVAERLKT